jgi:hypothetical protein
MPFIRVIVIIVGLLGISPLQALAKGSCKEVSLHTGKAVLSGQTTGGDTDPICFRLRVDQGATLRLQIARASSSDIAFNISDVIDNQDDFTFVAKKDTYRVDVYNTFRASRPGSFRILASVVKPAAKGEHLVVPQKDATRASASDQPLGIIQKMYSDLLTKNYSNAINSKRNRSRYFVPALVRLYAADDQRACVAGIGNCSPPAAS